MPKLKMDNALFRAMSRLGDLLLLNLLWVACSLPLVTAGAAATGLLYAARRMLACEDYNPRKDFLRAFQRNFRQATALWLLLAGAAALFVFDLYIAFHTPGALGNLLRGTGLVLCLLWLAAAGNAFALLARYEYTLCRLLADAFYLCASCPLSAAASLGSALWMPLLAWYDPALALYLLPAWLLAGAAVWGLLLSAALAPVFRRLEEQKEEEP